MQQKKFVQKKTLKGISQEKYFLIHIFTKKKFRTNKTPYKKLLQKKNFIKKILTNINLNSKKLLVKKTFRIN